VSEPLALTLARFAAETKQSPEQDRALARLRILDTIGLIRAGMATPQGRACIAGMAADGAPEATLIPGGKKISARAAAMIHGTLAHCLDFDDTFPDTLVHPGSVVVPVALAMAEKLNKAGDDVLDAVAIGYEIAARAGAPAGRKLVPRGFHASGVFGPMAGAATAGRLMGLTPEQIANAMGHAGSMAGGLMEFSTDGSWTKWLHTGWSAHGAILAAELARAGFRGPPTVLDGKNGLYAAFLKPESADMSRAATELGHRWDGRVAGFKFYPTAHIVQPFIDMALDVRERHKLMPDRIAAVRCDVPPWMAPIMCEPRDVKLRPKSQVNVAASLYFLVAAALIDGAVTLDTIAEPSFTRADILALAQKVAPHIDPALGASFDGRLAVTTTDGQTFKAAAPTEDAAPRKVRTKFAAIAGSGTATLAPVIEDIAARGPAAVMRQASIA
jgi:2-methylcitrate dehydratase PrpD